MIKKRRWLWVILFVAAALLLSVLATGWNVVLVRDYQHILALAQSLSIPDEINVPQTHLIVKMILGTLGFVVVLGLTIILFIKLLSEMRLNQLQSEFLAAISHELKTPIAAIELSASLLTAGGLSTTETQRLWSSHQGELKRLKEEVEALLEAARWQNKPSFFQKSGKEKIHLEQWLQESMERWQTLLGPKAKLTREGPPLQSELLGDPKTLTLIFENLMNNARKYAQGVPSVLIRTQQVGKQGVFSRPKWQIQIEDQGWGFDSADSKKIFHRFFRAKTSAPYAIPGTGLGLFLARSASQSMNLILRGDSKGTGRGAVFTLEGPA